MAMAAQTSPRQNPINGVHSIRCNAYRNAFVIATEKGVKMYSMDPLTMMYLAKKSEVGTCKMAELRWDSGIIGMIPGGSAPKFSEQTVIVYQFVKKKTLWRQTYSGSLFPQTVRFTKNRFIVVFLEKIYIYEFKEPMQVVLQEVNTGFNPRGLCEVTLEGMMVFPAPSRGQVQVMNVEQVQDGTTVAPTVINAHEGEIACVAISNGGTTIATASQKGTLVRVFNVATKKKELELRRGCDSAIVYSIAFSPCDKFLSACSDKGTVHIFAVSNTSLNRTNVLQQVGTMLPSNLGKPFEGQKSLAQFSIAEEYPSILVYLDNHYIVAISMDGTFQKYLVTQSGQCNLKTLCWTLDMGDDFYQD